MEEWRRTFQLLDHCTMKQNDSMIREEGDPVWRLVFVSSRSRWRKQFTISITGLIAIACGVVLLANRLLCHWCCSLLWLAWWNELVSFKFRLLLLRWLLIFAYCSFCNGCGWGCGFIYVWGCGWWWMTMWQLHRHHIWWCITSNSCSSFPLSLCKTKYK